MTRQNDPPSFDELTIPQPNFMRNPYADNAPFEDMHAVVSITLGELIRDSIVIWGAEMFMWDYYDEKQYWRVCEKIENHYWDREIGILPVRSWIREFMRTMNEIMPKYKLLYKALDENGLMQVSDRYGKSRDVGSDFPATQISPANQDYASGASDHEHEDIVTGDFLARYPMMREFDDIDVMIVDRLDVLFSSLYTVNINY